MLSGAGNFDVRSNLRSGTDLSLADNAIAANRNISADYRSAAREESAEGDSGINRTVLECKFVESRSTKVSQNSGNKRKQLREEFKHNRNMSEATQEAWKKNDDESQTLYEAL